MFRPILGWFTIVSAQVFDDTVDGCEILRRLISGKHPIIYRASTIQGGAGFRNHPQYHAAKCQFKMLF